MFLGIIIQKKRYRVRDYVAVFTLVLGLSIFLHADMNSSAIFHPLGVILLSMSLTCDGTLNNWSESMMETYSLSQDEFHSKLYIVSLLATIVAAFGRHELWEGIDYFLLRDGTVGEIESGAEPTWRRSDKWLVLLLFSTTGIMGASCLGAITKRFGALNMALTSTARKATTLFLSFGLFHNSCTPEHVLGVSLFMGALLLKALGKATGSIKKQDDDSTTAGDGKTRGNKEQAAGEESEDVSSDSRQQVGSSRLLSLSFRSSERKRSKLLHHRSSIDLELGIPTD
jgi:adenosine 3'-phospho 5'-phosphosulfate transporter B3